MVIIIHVILLLCPDSDDFFAFSQWNSCYETSDGLFQDVADNINGQYVKRSEKVI